MRSLVVAAAVCSLAALGIVGARAAATAKTFDGKSVSGSFSC